MDLYPVSYVSTAMFSINSINALGINSRSGRASHHTVPEKFSSICESSVLRLAICSANETQY